MNLLPTKPLARHGELRRPSALLFLALALLVLPSLVRAQVGDPALEQLQNDFHHAIAAIKPSVVGVRAQKRYTGKGQQPGMWYESIGSGFVVDGQGYILTNNHVVDGAEAIDVTMWPAQGNKFSAKLAHVDKDLDLALLQIDAGRPLTPAVMANSDVLETGDWVLSVGSPFGFAHTVTMGMISASKRDLVIGGRTYDAMIQTDAVINEGNSGGPLIDINGRVVGINTAIYAPDGTYTGLGFAIPVNRARHFFTLVTGAIPAALTQPAGAGGKMLPIDMNMRRPQDAIHQDVSDCTQCHLITSKSVVSTQLPMPHPMVGACSNCHILENQPPAGKAVPVAASRLVPGWL